VGGERRAESEELEAESLKPRLPKLSAFSLILSASLIFLKKLEKLQN
jgi:hypothetical protein